MIWFILGWLGCGVVGLAMLVIYCDIKQVKVNDLLPALFFVCLGLVTVCIALARNDTVILRWGKK